jgi:hypothetical protein
MGAKEKQMFLRMLINNEKFVMANSMVIRQKKVGKRMQTDFKWC